MLPLLYPIQTDTLNSLAQTEAISQEFYDTYYKEFTTTPGSEFFENNPIEEYMNAPWKNMLRELEQAFHAAA